MVHNFSFDEKEGLGKTKEELETEGVLIEGLTYEQISESLQSTLYYTPQT